MKQHKRSLAGFLTLLLIFLYGTPAFAAWPDEWIDCAVNLVQNPGFEDGLNGWETEGNCELTSAPGGGQRVSLNDSQAVLRQTVTFPHPGQYELQGFFSRAANSAGAGILKLNHTSGEFKLYSGNSDGLQRAGGIVEIPENGELTATLEIGAMESPFLLVDNISLTPVSGLPDPPPVSPEKNRIPNPGFEEEITDWHPFFNKSTTEQIDIAREGNFSMAVLGNSGSPAVAHIEDQALPAGEYEISAWFYCYDQPADGFDVFLMAEGSENTPSHEIGVHTTLPSDEQWHKLSYHIKLAEADSLLVLLGSYVTGADFFVDDLSVTPLAEESIPSPEDVNQLQNPGFEDGLSGWTQEGATNAFTTQEQHASGASSAFFSYFTPSPMEDCLSQTVPASPGQAFVFTALVNPHGSLLGAGAQLVLEARAEDGTVLSRSVSPACSGPAGEWKRLCATLAMPEGTAAVTAKLGGLACTGGFYADGALLFRR